MFYCLALGVFDGFAGLDLDALRLNRLRQLAHEVDLQEPVLKRSLLDLDEISETEAPLEITAGNTAIEIIALAGLLGMTGDDQRVLLHRDVDRVRLEASDRERDAIGVLAGAHDVVRREAVLRLESEAFVHQIEEAIEAHARAPERIK